MNKIGFVWLFIIAASVLSISVANAQDSPLTFGIKAGVNYSDFSGDVKGTKRVFKYQFGVTVDYELVGNMYFQSGLEFLTKGSKIKSSNAKYNPMYLQVPLHLAYKYEIAPATKLVVSVGPYLAYGIGGKMKTGTKTDFFGKDKFKRFDFGLGAGLGLEFGKIVVIGGYDFGLTNISDVKGTKVRNGNAYLTLGYRF